MKLKAGELIKTVPEGKYLILVREIKQSTAYKRPCLVFTCEIVEGKHKGDPVKAFANADYETFSSKTKLYQWYQVATGKEYLEQGETIDTDEFLCKIFEAQIETKTSRKTKIEFSNVTQLIRLVREI